MEQKIQSHAPTDEAESRAGRFHPLVYKVLAGLVAWFVAASWLFAGNGRTDYLLAVASGLILVMAGLPALLGLTRRTMGRRRGEAPEESEFGDWASRDVQLWTGPLQGKIAAVETIVPVASVAIGMTLFGTILLLVR